MFKYENSENEYMKIYTREKGSDDYWIFINLFSNSIDSKCVFSMEMVYQALIRNNMLYNSELSVMEGRNQIHAFLHQMNPELENQEASFLELGMQSYFSADNASGIKDIESKEIDKSILEQEIMTLASDHSIDTDVEVLSDLLLPKIETLQELLVCTNPEIQKQGFTSYQQKTNSVMLPLRKKVYEKKWNRPY